MTNFFIISDFQLHTANTHFQKICQRNIKEFYLIFSIYLLIVIIYFLTNPQHRSEDIYAGLSRIPWDLLQTLIIHQFIIFVQYIRLQYYALNRFILKLSNDNNSGKNIRESKYSSKKVNPLVLVFEPTNHIGRY